MSQGASYSAPGEAYRASHFVDTLIQNQVCLLGAVALAVVASRVNLSLRRRTFDARRVGQYDIGRQIGSGAMGEVYLATHSLLKRETALKFLRSEITGRETQRRFEQEVKLASQLTHPNTISIYDYGYTADGMFYYAMELLEGATLKDLVGGTGALSPARVIDLISQACAALQEAHSKGILHRDIKAANIMVCERGGELDRIKILDFGLAHRLGPAEGVTAGRREVSGTPETMAPEVWKGEPLGPAADLYSLAVVAYQLAVGVVPFKSESIETLAGLHHPSGSALAAQSQPGCASRSGRRDPQGAGQGSSRET